MRTLDQIYGSDGVLYVTNFIGELVNPPSSLCRMVAGTYRFGGREYAEFLITIRDLMLAGF